MFQLDALVLLRVNEAKAWGTSIYSYVEASWCALLLIDLHWACVLSVQFMIYKTLDKLLPTEVIKKENLTSFHVHRSN